MTFEEILDAVLARRQRRGRVTDRPRNRQFHPNAEAFEDLKDQLLDAHPQVAAEDGRGLVSTGSADSALPPPTAPVPPAPPSTPPHRAEKILAARPALAGERTQVTGFVADLTDATRLLEGLDPEAAQQLLDPAIHLMMDAVPRFEGTVNQGLGDGMMALVCAPIAHEDHALRACDAALALQRAVRPDAGEVRRRHGMTLHLRVGLNAGAVVGRTIGNDLHMDDSAVGQTTHLAACMEPLATPSSALLTAATLRLVEGLVQVPALGPVPVKGLTEPGEAYALVGARALRRRLQAAAARGLMRFVGRRTTLAALRQALDRAMAMTCWLPSAEAALAQVEGR
jgi:class 3 adenylate cyclase